MGGIEGFIITYRDKPEVSMSDSTLTFWSSWASIASLVISAASLYQISTVVRFRRRQRVRQLVDASLQIPVDAVPLTNASKNTILALKRNTNVFWIRRFTGRGNATAVMHDEIDKVVAISEAGAGDLTALHEAIKDWSSHSEDV